MVVLSELPGRPCPIAAALEVVGDRWALLAVREVHLGAHRFSDVLAGTGAPRDRLAARLKDLVAAGVLERRQYQDAPPRSDYHLTEAGQELVPVLAALEAWGRRWAVEDESPRPPDRTTRGAVSPWGARRPAPAPLPAPGPGRG